MALTASTYLHPSAWRYVYFLDETKYISHSVISFVYIFTSYHIKINTPTPNTHAKKIYNSVFRNYVIISTSFHTLFCSPPFPGHSQPAGARARVGCTDVRPLGCRHPPSCCRHPPFSRDTQPPAAHCPSMSEIQIAQFRFLSRRLLGLSMRWVGTPLSICICPPVPTTARHT